MKIPNEEKYKCEKCCAWKCCRKLFRLIETDLCYMSKM